MPVVIRMVSEFPGYAVGNDGSVWSYWKTRGRKGLRGVESFISPTRTRMQGVPRPDGYTRITFRKQGRAYDFLLHRLVLTVFVGPCPEGRECCHRDGDKSNSKLTNLYWGTRLENIQDSIKHGTFLNATRAAAAVNTGKPRTAEVRSKISAGNKGKPKSEGHKAALKKCHWSKGPNAAEIIAKREETKRSKGNSGRPR
jgi:hypothetical protein